MPAADLSPLFEPLALAGTELPNRLMTSAMTLQYGEAGLISDRHLAIYEERARGGVGLMFSEQLTASPLSPSPFPSEILAYDVRQVERFAALAERLEPYPSRFFAQLFCGGVKGVSTTGLKDWGPVRGPSRIAAPGGEVPLPLSADELAQIAADFARSARHVKAGGLDGVEIHGAHGWLVGQFLSPFYNRREDRYGGSVENRCRLALEIGRAMRAAVGPEFPLGIALTYDEMVGGGEGITEEDTLAQLEVMLAAELFDFYDFSVGSPHSTHFTIAPMAVPQGFALGFSGRARELIAGRAAVFVAGRIVDPRMAAAAVRDGAVDVVAMSRAQLADPHLARKSREGRTAEIRRCVGANVCVGRARAGEPVACVLSPATGRELDGWPSGDLPRVASGGARRVLIVGAGPAGLRAGAIAAARGHEVTVFERRDRAGGHLADLAWLPTRGGWGLGIEDLLSELARAGGALRLDTEVDRGLIERESPDLVLLAAGAEWDDGAAGIGEGPQLLGLGDALDLARTDPSRLGGSVLIADDTGTYAPLGLAEALAGAGATVRFVTARAEIGSEPDFHLELPHLLPRLGALGVTLAAGRALRRIDGDAVELTDLLGGPPERHEGIDTVVLALGRRPRDRLAAELAGVAPELLTIGDALAPRPTAAAIEEAERVALSI